MIKGRSLCLGLALALAGCAGMHDSPDFERHSNSQLTVPHERDDVVYFDVKLSANYPDRDAAAEAKRMEWLQAWLDFKGLCPNGYEIVNRREFRFEELNAGRYDLRYEVACTTEAAIS
jgi:hypothetical protein